MPGVIACEHLPAVSVLGKVQLELERATRLFHRAKSGVGHTLRIASEADLLSRLPQARCTRTAPCVWGARRDDFHWRGDGERDFSILLKGASVMGQTLVRFALPGWNALTPGSMQQMMGTASDLYLADYWLLTLHWLVWSRRLPYPIQAKWLRGQSIHDPTFGFQSELPTNLASASLDALIVFREATVSPIASETAMAVAEPPMLHEGIWRSSGQAVASQGIADQAAIDQAAIDRAVTRPVMHTVTSEPDLQAPPPHNTVEDSNSAALPELNDQTFTVRCGGRTYRFTARNKQLFALLDRIRRRPGHRVSFDDLRGVGDVWDGSQVEDSTIGGAIARLRKLLKAQGMMTLAQRITTGSYQGRRYVILQTADVASAADEATK